MANEEYIDVAFNIFEYEGQRARVKRALTVRTLINEVLREFDDIPADPLNRYVIYMKGADTPLDESKSLMELDIQPQDELVFDHFRRFLRKNLPSSQVVSFIEVQSGESFEIKWQPALIGRTSQDMDHNIILAVDLDYLPNGKTISRSHAELTFENGKYYIRPMAENNPVYLNGKEMPFGRRFEIRHRDELSLGYQKVTLFFRTQATGKRPVEVDTKEEKIRTSVLAAEEPSATLIDGSSGSGALQTPALIVENAFDVDLVGETILLVSLPFVIGRAHPSFTKEDQVSRRHAEITQDVVGGTVYVTDLGSTNGTLVNGGRIEPNHPVALKKGDHIRFGNVLTVRFEG